MSRRVVQLTHVTGRKRGVHGGPLVGGGRQAARVLQRRRLALPAPSIELVRWTLPGQASPAYVQNRVSFLYPHVVAAAEYLAIGSDESSSNLDPVAPRASVSMLSSSFHRTHERRGGRSWYRDASFLVRRLRLVERHCHSLSVVHFANGRKHRCTENGVKSRLRWFLLGQRVFVARVDAQM